VQQHAGVELIMAFAAALRSGADGWTAFERMLRRGEDRWAYRTHLTRTNERMQQPGCPRACSKEPDAAYTTALQKFMWRQGGHVMSTLFWPGGGERFAFEPPRLPIGTGFVDLSQRNLPAPVPRPSSANRTGAPLGPYWYPPVVEMNSAIGAFLEPLDLSGWLPPVDSEYWERAHLVPVVAPQALDLGACRSDNRNKVRCDNRRNYPRSGV
jgi:hypothetical protein